MFPLCPRPTSHGRFSLVSGWVEGGRTAAKVQQANEAVATMCTLLRTVPVLSYTRVFPPRRPVHLDWQGHGHPHEEQIRRYLGQRDPGEASPISRTRNVITQPGALGHISSAIIVWGIGQKRQERASPTRSVVPREVRPEKLVGDGSSTAPGGSGVHVHDQGWRLNSFSQCHIRSRFGFVVVSFGNTKILRQISLFTDLVLCQTYSSGAA